MDIQSLMQQVLNKKKEFVKNEKPYTAKTGENRIVILPGWDKPEVFWREFGGHFIKDPSGKTIGYYPCDDVIFQKPCPVCASLAEIARSTNDQLVLDAIKKARPSKQYLLNVIVVGEFNNEPQIMSMSKTAFEQLLNVIGSWGQNIFDPTNPQVVTISRSGTGFDTKYMVGVAPDRLTLPADIMSKIKNLDEYVNQRTDSMMNKCLQAINSLGGARMAIAHDVVEHKPTQIAYEDLPSTGTVYQQPAPVAQPAYAQPAYAQPAQVVAPAPMPAPAPQPAYAQPAYAQPAQQAPSLQNQQAMMNQSLDSMLSEFA